MWKQGYITIDGHTFRWEAKVYEQGSVFGILHLQIFSGGNIVIGQPADVPAVCPSIFTEQNSDLAGFVEIEVRNGFPGEHVRDTFHADNGILLQRQLLRSSTTISLPVGAFSQLSSQLSFQPRRCRIDKLHKGCVPLCIFFRRVDAERGFQGIQSGEGIFSQCYGQHDTSK